MSQNRIYNIDEPEAQEGEVISSVGHINRMVPCISIIIPVYNNELLIARAVESVISQQYGNIELIVVDGGSTDGSLEVLKIYEEQIDCLISEPDRGIYDAMNKGISQAQGEWIYFLGSDDALEQYILLKMIPYLTSDFSLVYGDVYLDDKWRYPSNLSPRTILQNTIHHQGAFYNKNLFNEFRYDTQLRILSDYELNLRIYWENLRVQKVPLVIANCLQGGASSQVNLSIVETNMIRSRFIRSKIMNWGFSVILRAYYAQKQIRANIFK